MGMTYVYIIENTPKPDDQITTKTSLDADTKIANDAAGKAAQKV